MRAEARIRGRVRVMGRIRVMVRVGLRMRVKVSIGPRVRVRVGNSRKPGLYHSLATQCDSCLLGCPGVERARVKAS